MNVRQEYEKTMKNKTNIKTAVPRCWLARLVLLGLSASLTACGVNPLQKCEGEKPHGWGKWEIIDKPDNYFDHVELQRRTCQHCGYSERESSHPK